MTGVIEREKTLRNRVITIQPTSRIERLRQRYLNTKDMAVIDLIRIRTRVMKETEREAKEIREAKAFAATVREVPINIYPDELFVGWQFLVPRGSPLKHHMAIWMEAQLDTLSIRAHSPFYITDDEIRELREEIIPYWKTHLRSLPNLPAEVGNTLRLFPVDLSKIYANDTFDHWCNGYDEVLEKGLLGIKKEAEERLARLDLTSYEDARKLPFVQGVIIALEAAAEIGPRFALRARELAQQEKNEQRKIELLKIAEVCEQVPAHPARTFYEAIQSVWFILILQAWDNEQSMGRAIGRADQYLYPYYKKDLEEGRITREQAQELIDDWLMRYSQHFPIFPGEDKVADRATPGMHLDVGGMKPDGTDGTNDISFMLIEGMMHTPGIVEPTISLLVHSKTPDNILIKACQLTALGSGFPQYINHDLMVDMLLSRGGLMGGPPLSIELARQCCNIGCHEPTVPNMQSGFGGFSVINLPALFECVFTNGVRRIDGRKIGIETGDPRKFNSLEDVKKAFLEQLAWRTKNEQIMLNIYERIFIQPKMFTSALTKDCTEKGLSYNEGGARYNPGVCAVTGIVDVGNAIAAVKKLVFDEKVINMAELCDALDHNFKGYDNIRKMCLKVPKFGNDIDYVDEQVAWVAHVVTEKIKEHKNTRGGHIFCMQIPWASFMTNGMVVGALPSGRLAGEPESDGVSPNAGSDVNGPTSMLKSVGKINNAEVAFGQTLNMKIDPVVFEKEDGFKKLADLIRVFVDQKVDEIQINVVNSNTLRAAQQQPEKYKDLIVKVAGYQAHFVELYRELQDAIIARTEHKL